MDFSLQTCKTARHRLQQTIISIAVDVETLTMHVMAVAIQLDLPKSLWCWGSADPQTQHFFHRLSPTFSVEMGVSAWVKNAQMELLNFVSLRLTHQPMFQHYITANLGSVQNFNYLNRLKKNAKWWRISNWTQHMGTHSNAKPHMSTESILQVHRVHRYPLPRLPTGMAFCGVAEVAWKARNHQHFDPSCRWRWNMEQPWNNHGTTMEHVG